MGQLLNFTYKVVSPKAGDRVFGSKSGQGTVFENHQKKSQVFSTNFFNDLGAKIVTPRKLIFRRFARKFFTK